MTRTAQPAPPVPTPGGQGAPTIPREGRAIPILLRIWLGFVLLYLLPAWITMPYGRDQGIFAQVVRTMLDGGVPYRDAWEVKGPFTYVPYHLAFRLLGPSEEAYNLTFLAILFSALVVAARSVRRWAAAGSGVLAALLLLNKAKLGFWFIGQPDTIVACLAVFLVAACTVEPGRLTPRMAVLCGVLVAAAAWIKPPYLLLGFAPALAFGFAQGWSVRRLARLSLAFASGGLLLTTLVLAPYAASGSLGDLWEVLVEFNLASHVDRGHQAHWPGLLPRWTPDRWARIDAILVIGKCAGALLMAVHHPRRATVLAAAWGGCYLAAGAQGKFWDHHFVPSEFMGSLFAAYGLSAALAVVGRPSASSLRRLVAAACLLAVLHGSLAVQCRSLNTGTRWWLHSRGLLDEREWMRPFAAEGFNLASIRDAAAAARRFSAPGEPLYLWGFDSLLHVESDRPSPTRFIFNYPLLVGAPDYVARCRAELMGDLAARPPRIIAVQDLDANPLYRYTSREKLADFPELAALIATEYRECHRNDHFALYQRVSP